MVDNEELGSRSLEICVCQICVENCEPEEKLLSNKKKSATNCYDCTN